MAASGFPNYTQIPKLLPIGAWHAVRAASVTAVKRGFDVRGLLDRLRAGDWSVLARLSGDRPLVPAASVAVRTP